MPVQDIQTFVSLGGEDHIVFNGPDEQFLGGRLMGAKAGIGGTYGAMPELFLKLNQLITDKDLETARALTPVTEEDRPVVEAAAALIRETKERFL
ncbi:N-acetylneuraminate lyase [Streptococcus pneumoniae]|nr:N-acetylneuraminate lyase [Streptococcus pneumoniae]